MLLSFIKLIQLTETECDLTQPKIARRKRIKIKLLKYLYIPNNQKIKLVGDVVFEIHQNTELGTSTC